ncbi:cytochrome c oxidase assembly factor 1 homolog [Battus philenor]|uniref:cytochrome c oxidase assembly factor 1 homolog n=1 Tax=Battus philenor TaxID=42288 RepID=UPI0035D05642
MPVATSTLVKIAGWGGLVVSATGFYLQNKLIDRYRNFEYYKEALRKLRNHSGAVLYLGEPIKDRRFKISDRENNFSDQTSARFRIPIHGPKDKGYYYFWAKKDGENWLLVKAEMELNSKPGERLVIIKENKN